MAGEIQCHPFGGGTSNSAAPTTSSTRATRKKNWVRRPVTPPMGTFHRPSLLSATHRHQSPVWPHPHKDLLVDPFNHLKFEALPSLVPDIPCIKSPGDHQRGFEHPLNGSSILVLMEGSSFRLSIINLAKTRHRTVWWRFGIFKWAEVTRYHSVTKDPPRTH